MLKTDDHYYKDGGHSDNQDHHNDGGGVLMIMVTIVMKMLINVHQVKPQCKILKISSNFSGHKCFIQSRT